MSKLDKAGATVYSIDTDGIFYSIPKGLDDPLPFQTCVVTSRTWWKIQKSYLFSL